MADEIKKNKINLIFLIIAIFCTHCHAGNPNKVMGGIIVTRIDQHPFSVSILHQRHQLCGGSIISKYFILTSASCVILELSPKTLLANLKIVTGTTDKYGFFGNGSIHKVAYIVHHDEYNDRLSWVNDIALLKTEKQIEFSHTTRNILLAGRFSSHAQQLTILGWGGIRYLSMIVMTFTTQHECQEAHSNFEFFHGVQGCVRSDDELRRGVVDGDSGSSMVEEKGRLVGVMSLISPTKIGHAIFTKVWPFKSWILHVTSIY